MIELIKKNSLYLAFAGSLFATLGSLYFSKVLDFPPCELCWYQRIATFPLVVIIGFAIYKKNREILLPGFVLAGIGVLVGIFHNLLYYGIVSEEIAPCVEGISCTTEFLSILGFLDIPQLGLLGILGILAMMVVYWKSTNPQGE